ncbi:MAG: hypothetical protein AB8I80_25505 [Anaerolineae bacterium]|jgi:hypothetical protein
MDCWSQVQNLRGRALHTLVRRYPFEVLSVEEGSVLLRPSTGKERTVSRHEIEGAFDELRARGEIDLHGIERRHSARGVSYVAAILAQLAGVSAGGRPLVLRYDPSAAASSPRAEHSLLEHGSKSRTVLVLIAEGRTYEQILALHPELTYYDIFAAAKEALAHLPGE